MLSIRFSVCALLRRLFRPKGLSLLYTTGVSLPPPLTQKEEAEVMAMLQKNDPQAKNILITRNLRLVVYIAKKFESTGIPVEDLVSIGSIGLIKAVNTFSPEKKIKLATYASRCIENEILMVLRKNSHQKGELSLDEPLNVDWDGNELLLSDVLGTEEDLNKKMEQQAENDLLLSCIRGLEEREQQIMELRFGLNGKKAHTQKEVADKIGISQSYISRLEKRTIQKLRRELSAQW